MMKTYTRTITGADGEQYIYTLQQHPAGEGLELFARLMSTCGGSLGELLSSMGLSSLLPALKEQIGPLLQAVKEEGREIKVADLLQATNVLEALDPSKLGSGLTMLATSFLTHGGADLCRKLLGHTTRAPEAGGAGIKLSTSSAFDLAYQGNYGELVSALGWAFWCNFACLMGSDPFAQG